jgi:hypothetical protein
MLREAICQLVLALVVLSALVWLPTTLLLGRKASPFWIFGWMIKKSFRFTRKAAKEISKSLFRLRKKLLKAAPENLAGYAFYVSIAMLIGIVALLVAIPVAVTEA